MANRPKHCRAFTLVELLVALSIISLLIALLIPGVQAAREVSRRISCQNNLKQAGIALNAYHNIHNCFPYGQADFANSSSFWIKLLPVLEQGPLYSSLNQHLSVFDDVNQTVRVSSIATLCCPSDSFAVVRPMSQGWFASYGYPMPKETPYAFFTSYVGNFGSTDTTSHFRPDSRGFSRADGVISDVSPISMASVVDGASNTFLASERATAYLNQLGAVNPTIVLTYGMYFRGALGDTLFTTLYPPNMPKKVGSLAGPNHAFAASSYHGQGLNTLMADGSVRFIKETIDSWPFDPITGYPAGASEGPGGFWSNLPAPGLWQTLSTRNGGEIISNDY